MQDGTEVISCRGDLLPLLHLRRLFHLEGESKDSFHVFVTNWDFGAVAIAVDRIEGLREIVVRRVEDSFVRVQGIAGATDLGDGRPVLILGVSAIVETAMAKRT
jgi:two-component system chemotaxis sensor kinase CheA